MITLDKDTAIHRIRNQIINTINESDYSTFGQDTSKTIAALLRVGLESLQFDALNTLFIHFQLDEEEIEGHYVQYAVEHF